MMTQINQAQENSQKGVIGILAAVLVVIVVAAILFFFFSGKTPEKISRPLPSPSIATTVRDYNNAQLYEKHREKIQNDLNLSDTQFEILKDSADEY